MSSLPYTQCYNTQTHIYLNWRFWFHIFSFICLPLSLSLNFHFHSLFRFFWCWCLFIYFLLFLLLIILIEYCTPCSFSALIDSVPSRQALWVRNRRPRESDECNRRLFIVKNKYTQQNEIVNETTVVLYGSLCFVFILIQERAIFWSNDFCSVLFVLCVLIEFYWWKCLRIRQRT